MIDRSSINKLIAAFKAKFSKSKADDLLGAESDSRELRKKQWLMLAMVVIIAASSFYLVSYLLGSFSNNKSTAQAKTSATARQSNLRIELADETLKSEKLWLNFFEDKLDDTKGSLEQKINEAQESLQKTESKLEQKTVAA